MLKPVAPNMVGVQIFACTDDGHIMSWNGNELRQKGEDGYRLTHTSVLARKPPPEESATGTPQLPPHRQDKEVQRASLSEEITRRQSLELSEAELAELLLVNARLTDSFFKIALNVPTDHHSQDHIGGKSDTPGTPATGRRRRKGFVDSLADGVVTQIEPNRYWKVDTHSNSLTH